MMKISKTKFLSYLTYLNIFLLISTFYSVYEPIVYVVSIVLISLTIAFGRFKIIGNNSVILILLIFSVLLSLLLSIDFKQSLIPSIYLCYLFFIAIVMAENIQNIVLLERFIFYTILGFLIFNFRNFFADFSDIRFSGVTGQPNALGLVAGTGVAITILYLYICNNIGYFQKIITFSVLFSGMYLVLISGSRGAFISLIVAIIYLSLKNFIKNIKFILIICMAGIIAYNVFYETINQSPIYNRLLALPSAVGFNLPSANVERDYEAAADDTRLNIADQAIEGFLAHPIWGNGISTFSHYSDFVYTHNSYLEIFYSLGIIGGFLYVLFLFKFLFIKITYEKSDLLIKKLVKGKNFIIIYFIIAGFSIPNFQNKSQIAIYTILLIMVVLIKKKFYFSNDYTYNKNLN